MERMEEMLDLFKEYTCVEFLRLRTEEEKNQYDYKIMIVDEENNINGSCKSWSKHGETERNSFI
jgi:stage III sporulation protein SpoIIIAA